MKDLAKYADWFKENNITGQRLLQLTHDDLWNMGITSLGHRVDFEVLSKSSDF